MFGLEMFGKIQEVIEELDPEDIKSKIKFVVDSVIEMRDRQERIERKLDLLHDGQLKVATSLRVIEHRP
jgi:hypothetical protein